MQLPRPAHLPRTYNTSASLGPSLPKTARAFFKHGNTIREGMSQEELTIALFGRCRRRPNQLIVRDSHILLIANANSINFKMT